MCVLNDCTLPSYVYVCAPARSSSADQRGAGDNVHCNHMYLSVRAHVHVCVQVLIHTWKCALSLRPSLGLRLIVFQPSNLAL